MERARQGKVDHGDLALEPFTPIKRNVRLASAAGELPPGLTLFHPLPAPMRISAEFQPIITSTGTVIQWRPLSLWAVYLP